MSQSYRRNALVALAGTLLGFTIILCAVFVWSEYQRGTNEYEQYRQTTHNKQQQAAENIASKCNIVSAPSSLIGECLKAEIQTYQHQDASDQDLKAQQDMAVWGFWMFVASAGGLALSAIGLVLLFVSLMQTRTTIKDNRELGQAQVRAYPYISDVEIGHDRGNGGHLWISAKIENRGNSPALDFDVVFLLRFFVNNTTLELYVPFDCGGLDKGGNVFGPIHFTDARIPASNFIQSAAVHIEAAWFCIDVFEKETVGFAFFLVGGSPSPTYKASIGNKGPIPHHFSSGHVSSFRKKRSTYKGA